jgi:hypothetical protein
MNKPANSRYVKNGEPDEAAIYRDAWRIADPGASNPVAVAGTLASASAVLLHHIGTDGVRNHPALRLMAAQLASLYNVNADGGGGTDEDSKFIEQVKAVVDSLDRGDDLDVAIRIANAELIDREPRGIHGGDK